MTRPALLAALLAAGLALVQVPGASLHKLAPLIPARASLAEPLLFALIALSWRWAVFRSLPGAARRSLLLYAAVLLILLLVHPVERLFWISQLYLALLYATILALALSQPLQPLCRLALRWWLVVTLVLIGLLGALDVSLVQYVPEYATSSPWLSVRLRLLFNSSNILASYLLMVTLLATLGLSGQRPGALGRLALVLLVGLALLTRSRDLLLILVMLAALARFAAHTQLTRRLSLIGVILSTGLVLTGFLTREIMVLPQTPPYIHFKSPSVYRALAHEPYLRVWMQAEWSERLLGVGLSEAAWRSQALRFRAQAEKAAAPMGVGPNTVDQWMERRYGPHNTLIQILMAGGLLWLSAMSYLLLAPLWPIRKVATGPLARLATLFLALLLVHAMSRDLARTRWFWAEVAFCQAAILSAALKR